MQTLHQLGSNKMDPWLAVVFVNFKFWTFRAGSENSIYLIRKVSTSSVFVFLWTMIFVHLCKICTHGTQQNSYCQCLYTAESCNLYLNISDICKCSIILSTIYIYNSSFILIYTVYILSGNSVFWVNK